MSVTTTKEERISIEELTEIAKDFLRDSYDVGLNIPIERNNRLRSSMGRFIATYEDEPLRIELAGFLLKYGHRSAVIDTLKHECVHYALCVRGEPNSDGHPHFETELRRLGVSSTETTAVGLKYTYQCAECLLQSYTAIKKVKDHPENYYTKCCGATLINLKERIYDGTEEDD